MSRLQSRMTATLLAGLRQVASRLRPRRGLRTTPLSAPSDRVGAIEYDSRGPGTRTELLTTSGSSSSICNYRPQHPPNPYAILGEPQLSRTKVRTAYASANCPA